MLNKAISTPVAIIIILILVISVGGFTWLKYGEIWRESAELPEIEIPEKETSSLEGIVLLSLVEGCAETEEGMATKSVGEEDEQEPKIEVTGNKIKYSRAINHLCCRKAEISKEASNSIINIYEYWTGIGCKCMCFSEIETTLSNVPVGNYTVNVYEKGIKPGGNNEPMEQKLIISQEVEISEKDETADWKIYRSEEYGFEMMYPERFFYRDPSIIKSDCLTLEECSGEVKDINSVIYCVEKDEGAAAGSTYIEYYFTPINTSKEECFCISFVERFANCQNYLPCDEICEEYEKCKDFNETAPEVLNQILSTFKFIKERDEISSLLREVKEETNIDFPEIKEIEFSWDPIRIQGKGFEREITDEELATIKGFLLSEGFVMNMAHTGDGTLVAGWGFQKDQIVCSLRLRYQKIDTLACGELPKDYEKPKG